MQTSLLKTAFFTALASYLGFACVDYVEPRFVSNVFSVHLIGLLALLLGGLWARQARRTVTPKRWRALLVLLGIGAAVLVWREGEVFAEWRLLVSLAVAIIPMLFFAALSVRHE